MDLSDRNVRCDSLKGRWWMPDGHNSHNVLLDEFSSKFYSDTWEASMRHLHAVCGAVMI